MINPAKAGKKILLFLVYSDLIIGLLAASLLIITKILFELSLHFTTLDALIICCSVIAYNLSGFNATKFSTKKLVYYHVIQLIILLTVSLFLFFYSESWMLFIPPFIFWLIYFYPSINSSFKFKIRDNAILKVTVISFVWTWLTLFIPLSHKLIPGDLMFYHFMARFFFIAAISLANDLADEKQDRRNGTQTLPVVIGRKKTFLAIAICLLFFVFFVNKENLISSIEGAYAITAVFSALLIFLAFKIKEKSYCKLIVDSSIICQMLIISGIYFFT
ncbi:MAG: UbiA family prenyltransferase [Bacteroidia bacterium]